MKRFSSLATSAIAALSCGLVHCSSEPAQSEEIVSSGGADAAGSAGSATSPVAGSAPAETGGNATAGGGSGGSGVAGAGGSQSTASGSGGVQASGGGGVGGTAGAGNGSCSGDAIVCEDFEQYPAANAPAGGWTPTLRGDGKIVVDATRAFSGKQSLHVTGRMNADRANISRPIQTDSPTAYVRFMMYTASYPASAGVHTRLMRIGTVEAATGNPYTSFSLASYNGTGIEKVNSIYMRDTGTKFSDSKLLNRWACWEFAIDKTGGIGKVKVQIWVDGRALTLSPAGSSSHGMTSDSWDPIEFQLFMLGLDGFQADPQAADFWIDDLSVTPQRVGCNAPP
jgi:hypothetical protein